MKLTIGRSLLRVGLLLGLVGAMAVAAIADGGGIQPSPGTPVQIPLP